jgi:hypothetical protein
MDTDAAKLDERLRRHFGGDVRASGLLDEAVALPSLKNDRTPTWPSVAILGMFAIIAVAFWRGVTPSAGADASAALDTPVGHLWVQLDGSSVAVGVGAAGSDPAGVAPAGGGPSRPFVAQLVCGPEAPLSGWVVLFGYLGTSDAGQVHGLPVDQVSTGRDGTFLYATNRTVAAGTTWTVISGASSFGGPVAAWGVRESTPASTKACVVYDAAVEVKP